LQPQGFTLGYFLPPDRVGVSHRKKEEGEEVEEAEEAEDAEERMSRKEGRFCFTRS
jgi:hypothetical protein